MALSFIGFATTNIDLQSRTDEILFLHSRKPISLISHSDVRYRGILAGIDPQASTIQLSNGEKRFLFFKIEKVSISFVLTWGQFILWAPKHGGKATFILFFFLVDEGSRIDLQTNTSLQFKSLMDTSSSVLLKSRIYQ